MTQYAYTLVHGGDHRPMQDAFKAHAKVCEAEIAAGNCYPFCSDLLTMGNLLADTRTAEAEAYREFEVALARRASDRKP